MNRAGQRAGDRRDDGRGRGRKLQRGAGARRPEVLPVDGRVGHRRRADADVYYHNCAEYVTGQVALWSRRVGSVRLLARIGAAELVADAAIILAVAGVP